MKRKTIMNLNDCMFKSIPGMCTNEHMLGFLQSHIGLQPFAAQSTRDNATQCKIRTEDIATQCDNQTQDTATQTETQSVIWSYFS